MHKVTEEQMDSIIACMTDPVNGKDGEVFDALELSPYDYCQNGGELEFINVIYKRDIEDKIEEAKSYPEDYFDEDRAAEITAGAKFTADDMERVKASHIKSCEEDESAHYATISEVTDGNRSVFVAYIDSSWGQGGVNINEFLGFYISDQATRYALSQMDDMIFLRLTD
jgi:hypothetical protein